MLCWVGSGPISILLASLGTEPRNLDYFFQSGSFDHSATVTPELS